jgi:hypothetical protein
MAGDLLHRHQAAVVPCVASDRLARSAQGAVMSINNPLAGPTAGTTAAEPRLKKICRAGCSSRRVGIDVFGIL